MPESGRRGSSGPPDFRAILEDLVRGGVRDERELNRLMQQRIDEYNATPQADLGGLSPDQMHRLLHLNWRAGGPFRFARDIAPRDLEGSDMLADARAVLAFVRDAGEVKLTQARYLPPAHLATLLPSLRLERVALSTWAVKRESDALWLLRVREMLELAGALEERGRTLRITPEGHRLMREEAWGELFARMFEAFFSVIVSLEVPELWELGLESSIPFALHRLPDAARRWTSTRAIAAVCVPGGVGADDGEDQLRSALLEGFIYRAVTAPFLAFGLLEPREADFGIPESCRVTPLFGKFVHSEFRGASLQLT